MKMLVRSGAGSRSGRDPSEGTSRNLLDSKRFTVKANSPSLSRPGTMNFDTG
jgi:hypothetical protein